MDKIEFQEKCGIVDSEFKRLRLQYLEGLSTAGVYDTTGMT